MIPLATLVNNNGTPMWFQLGTCALHRVTVVDGGGGGEAARPARTSQSPCAHYFYHVPYFVSHIYPVLCMRAYVRSCIQTYMHTFTLSCIHTFTCSIFNVYTLNAHLRSCMAYIWGYMHAHAFART